SYIQLLQHCHKHNPTIISKLSKPDSTWIDNDRHLILAHNAINQLDILPQSNYFKSKRKKEIDSLISVLDQNQTQLGKRMLYNILQNPSKNKNEIEIYYGMIDEMINEKIDGDPIWLYLDRQM